MKHWLEVMSLPRVWMKDVVHLTNRPTWVPQCILITMTTAEAVRVGMLLNRTIADSLVHRYEVPTNFHSFIPYYFPYVSNSYTSFFRGVTLHSCHSRHGPWCATFLEVDHDGSRQRYVQRKMKGGDNIIFPWWTVHLLIIQLALTPIPMDLTHIWPLIFHKWSIICNECKSGRIHIYITCWCNNNKQLPYERDKRGKNTRDIYWLRSG
jgi:hypothetical protein